MELNGEQLAVVKELAADIDRDLVSMAEKLVAKLKEGKPLDVLSLGQAIGEDVMGLFVAVQTQQMTKKLGDANDLIAAVLGGRDGDAKLSDSDFQKLVTELAAG